MISENCLMDSSDAFTQLLKVIRTLRSKNGCPWDMKQTIKSFHPYILEEYHELVHAINDGDSPAMADEMGDLIFLVVFTAYMMEQEGLSSVAGILNMAVEKMTRRHPHVFGNVVAETPEDVIANWTRVKAEEKVIQERESLLDGVPRSLPALNRAQKLASRAAKVGFDWTRAEEVFGKIDEEIEEFKAAAKSGDVDHIREELGDVLFVIANAARHLGLNSESALNETSDKFERRFRYIEARTAELGKTMSNSSLLEMDELWDEAKRTEKLKNGKN